MDEPVQRTAESIVEALALATEPRDHEYEDCILCGAERHSPHVESCPWRQAQEYIASRGK